MTVFGAVFMVDGGEGENKGEALLLKHKCED